MRERPIIFSASMVSAILADRKSQTRRVVKPQPWGEPRPLIEWSSSLAAACHDHAPDPLKLTAHSDRLKGRIFPFTTKSGGLMSPTCPYGAPGDQLWVRETFRAPPQGPIYYRADDDSSTDGFVWKPAIHMPRSFCRLVLEVTAVRVERLQEISEADAKAEGLHTAEGDGYGPGPGYKWHGIGYHGAGFTKRGEPTFHTPRDDGGRCSCKVGGPSPAQCAYRELWDSLNAKRAPWASNPWVWCISFMRAA